ncbi:MAG: hypothetical protein ACP6KW_09215 [Candidatus Thorarchaeota archaeon]
MKLYYKVTPDAYRSCLEQIREKFAMHEEVDEARTILMLDDESQIERVIGTFDPNTDDVAQVRVTLVDESLRGFFDSVLGAPYKVR